MSREVLAVCAPDGARADLILHHGDAPDIVYWLSAMGVTARNYDSFASELGRHAIGSNYFWYLRDPAGNFAEYSSDLDVIVDQEAWKVASSLAVAGLSSWGPPVPREFLAPDDIVALAKGQ